MIVFANWFESSSYTVTTLAEVLGVSRQTVHNWLAGESRPGDVVTLMKIEKLSAGAVGLEAWAWDWEAGDE